MVYAVVASQAVAAVDVDVVGGGDKACVAHRNKGESVETCNVKNIGIYSRE